MIASALALGAGLAFIATPSAPVVYERWQAPPALEAPEREMVSLFRRRARRHGLTLAPDAGLTATAKALLPWAEHHAGDVLPVPLIEATSRQTGVTDGELSALAIRAAQGSLSTVLAREVDALLQDNSDLNRIGVAQMTCPSNPSEDPPQAVAVLVASRRLVHLAPVPRAVGLGRSVAISGTTLDDTITSLRLDVALPNDTTFHVALPRRQKHFFWPLTLPPQQGVVHVQLLVERGRGPEVAAEFPLAIGPSPTDVPTPIEAPASAAVASCAHHSLLSLVLGLREAHGLPLLMPSADLMHQAQQHADDMAQHHFFAHVSPRRGNAAERLTDADIAYRRVVENLAEAPEAEVAFADWHHSPSHLANLLDARVRQIGIGTAEAGGVRGESLFVLLMADLVP